ncbi:MAG: exodeoxyribonuclease VII small subunit [Arsenophonus sp.]
MTKKKISDIEDQLSFETSLTELVKIVTLLESGELTLDKALNEFEHGIKLAKQGQKTLQEAEHRVKILLQSNDENSQLINFSTENK